MSFAENASRWKEETGTAEGNTGNAFAGRAKTGLLFSTHSPPFLNFLPLSFSLFPFLYVFSYSSPGAGLLPSWNLHNCALLL